MAPRAKVTSFWTINSCRISDCRQRLYPNGSHQVKSGIKNQYSVLPHLSTQDAAYAAGHILVAGCAKFPDN